jgi:hypothetical protein
VKDVKAIIDMFLDWRKGYDAQIKEPTEKEDRQDEIADEAIEMLNKEENV